MKRKKKERIVGGRALGALVVGSVGSSLIGQAMPGTSGAPLQTIGSGFSKFVGPVATAVGAGVVVKQLRKLPQPKKKRKVKRR